MAIKNIVEYTENGLKVFKPDEGERHLVYVRPGDQINLDFKDDITFRIVDGDVLAFLRNGAQIVFLSLGSMSMTADESLLPKIFDKDSSYIDILNIAEVSELSDQNIPIQRRFLEFQPQSEEPTEIQERLSRQEETLQNTLETINDYVSEVSNTAVAGPKESSENEGDEKSGTQTTVEFVQETVEQVVRATESTTVPEANNPSRQTLLSVPQPDSNPTENTSTVQISTELKINNIEVLGFQGGFVGETREYFGGSGSDQSASDSRAEFRLEAEKINTSQNNADTVVHTENNQLITVTGEGQVANMTQVIAIDPEIPDGFNISRISFSGLPEGARVYSFKVNPNPANITDSTATLNGAGSSFNLLQVQDFDAGDKIQFIINYPTDASQFALSATATAVFDESSGLVVPDQTTLVATSSYDIVLRNVGTDVEDLTGNVLPTNPRDNEVTTGSGNDTIFGGVAVDNINSGEGNDTIYGGLGDDIINGGGGSDTISYASQSAGNFINVTMNDGANAGSVVVRNEVGIVETDSITSIENLTGTISADILHGNSSDNSLIGGAGNDLISGGAGNDFLDGGGEVDTLSYAYNTGESEGASTEGYNINLDTGRVVYNSTSSGGIAITETDQIQNFEVVVGSGLDDTIIGSSGDETLNGGLGNDTISSGGGRDVIQGGQNSDFSITINSRENSTNVIVGDTVDHSAITSNISLNLTTGVFSGVDGVSLQTELENVRGTSANDTLTSTDDADNVLYASGGQDIINLGSNTAVSVDFSNQDISITGGDTYDLSQLDTTDISATSVNLALSASNVILTQTVGSTTQDLQNAEHVIGSDKNDTIEGSSGSNYLAGGAGNDTITSGGGQDIIDGGVGVDQARFNVNSPAAGVTINYNADNQYFEITDSSTTSLATATLAMNIEQFVGSGSTDIFRGTAGNDYFDGAEGNDTIQATLGQDTILGGDGDDFIDYSVAGATNDANRFVNSSGRLAQLATSVSVSDANSVFGDDASFSTNNLAQEHLQYNTSVDLTGVRADMSVISVDTDIGQNYYQTQYAESIDGGGAIFRNNRVYSVENIKGSSANDYLAGDGFNNSLDGGIGNDFLAGRAGNDTLLGGDGSDILVGGRGNDNLDGGDGEDWASYQFSTTGVNVDLTNTAAQTISNQLGQDTISNIEHLISGSGADTLTGTSGINTIISGSGNDTVYGGGGADIIDGGEGEDTIGFNNDIYADGVTLTLNNTPGSSSAARYSTNGIDVNLTVSNIENIIGSSGNDTFTGNSLNNNIQGGAGKDTLDGGSGGQDILLGGEGDDTINYRVSDGGTVNGGDGIDTLNLSGIALDFTINLTQTNHAGTGLSNTVFNNIENITTDNGDQTLYASIVNNTINAGAGADTVYANSGTDIYDGGGNTVGIDTLTYEAFGSGSIFADFSANSQITLNQSGVSSVATVSNFEKLIGTQNNDVVTFGDRNRVIDFEGNAGDDTVTISAGALAQNNIVDGGTDNDTLNFTSDTTGITVNFNNTTGSSQNTVITSGSGLTTFSDFETINGTSQIDTLSSNRSIELAGASATVNGLTINFNNIEVLANTINTTGSTFTDVDTANFHTVLAGSGQDAFVISTGDAISNDLITLNGGAGEDRLTITSSTDTSLVGTTLDANNDQYTLASIETLSGNDGADTWNFSNFNNIVALNINTGGGNDNVTGSSQDDIINGGSGGDTLIGGSGTNTLIGGEGNDSYTITETDVIDFSENNNNRINELTITYEDGVSTNVSINNGAEQDTINVMTGTEELNLIGSSGNDSITITHGSTSRLNNINLNENAGNTDTDTVSFNGSLNNTIISTGSVTGFGNIEHLDFTEINTLATGESITLDVSSLYQWAGAETGVIDNAGATLTGREIQLNFQTTDVTDWSDIRFNLSNGATSNTSTTLFSGTDADSQTLSLTGANTDSSQSISSGSVSAGNEYHVSFNDAGGTGNDLHVVINVT